MSARDKVRKISIHAVLVILALVQGLPLLIVLMNSFRTDEQIKKMPLALPKQLFFDNYFETWTRGGYASAYLSNIFIGVFTVIIVCIFTGLAAHATVKLNILGRKFFMMYFIFALSIPAFAFIVPEYYILSKLHIAKTLWSLVLIYSATSIPFNFMLMRAFFIGIPKEIEESSKVDGCSNLGTIFHITLPLAKPIITTVALMVFVYTWNDFLWASTFIQDENLRTVSVRFYRFVSRFDIKLSNIFTAGVISILPICLLYLILQKNFIEGMTQGGVKG